MDPQHARERNLAGIVSRLLETRPLHLGSLVYFMITCAAAHAEVIELRPTLVEKGGVVCVEYRSGDVLVGRSTDAAPAGVRLLLPGATAVPVQFRARAEQADGLDLGPVKIGTLLLRLRITQGWKTYMDVLHYDDDDAPASNQGFHCDSGNYLLAGVHGLPAAEVDARLIERIQLELAHSPAFNEDINTVTGQPHGNTPYAD